MASGLHFLLDHFGHYRRQQYWRFRICAGHSKTASQSAELVMAFQMFFWMRFFVHHFIHEMVEKQPCFLINISFILGIGHTATRLYILWKYSVAIMVSESHTSRFFAEGNHFWPTWAGWKLTFLLTRGFSKPQANNWPVLRGLMLVDTKLFAWNDDSIVMESEDDSWEALDPQKKNKLKFDPASWIFF